MIMWIMSDRTIPRSFRFMEGFGVHTFRLVNAEGKSTFVKFHWKPKQGLQSVVWNEAVKINGADPDFHRRDLWDAIADGRLPGVGAGPAAVRRGLRRQVRLRRARRRPRSSPRSMCRCAGSAGWCSTACVDNFFAETEQVAFCTQNVVPGHRLHQRPAAAGAELLLPRHPAQAARRPELHAHPDQRAERCPFTNFQQDGHMAMPYPKGRANYEPNSWGEGPARVADDGLPHLPGRGERAQAAAPRRRPSPTTTARRGSSTSARPRSSSGTSRQRLTFELSKVETPAIRARMVSHLLNIDAALGRDGGRGPAAEGDAQAGAPPPGRPGRTCKPRRR